MLNNNIIIISVSNFHAPLSINDAFASTQALDKKRFKDLTTNSQSKICKKTKDKGYVIDFEKFKLWFVRYEGEEPDLSIESYLSKLNSTAKVIKFSQIRKKKSFFFKKNQNITLSPNKSTFCLILKGKYRMRT